MIKIFNASGHPIVSQEGVELVGAHAIPNVNMANTDEVMEIATSIARQAAPFLADGAFITLPGASVIAVSVISILGGISGALPRIAFALRGEDGIHRYSVESSLDLQGLRMQGRSLRPQ